MDFAYSLHKENDLSFTQIFGEFSSVLLDFTIVVIVTLLKYSYRQRSVVDMPLV